MPTDDFREGRHRKGSQHLSVTRSGDTWCVQNTDGSIAEPLGKAVRGLTVEQGYAAARLVGLSMLGSLKRALGRLRPHRPVSSACSAW